MKFLSKLNFREFLFKSFIILIGGLSVSISYSALVIPYNLLSGGVGGFALILGYLVDLPVYLGIFALNIPLFIWGFIELDKKLIFYSILGTLTLVVSLPLIQPYIIVPELDLFLASIFSGVLTGFGTGIIIKYGGSTGGTDIASLVLKKNRNISIGTTSFSVNATIILLSVIFFPLKISLYTLISMWVAASIVDFILDGLSKNKSITIITSNCAEFEAYIMKELKRGVTIHSGYGGYSHSEKKIINCVINNYEFARLKTKAPQIDPEVFMYVTDAIEVTGKGFKRYSTY